jgi:hypothetical protein
MRKYVLMPDLKEGIKEWLVTKHYVVDRQLIVVNQRILQVYHSEAGYFDIKANRNGQVKTAFEDLQHAPVGCPLFGIDLPEEVRPLDPDEEAERIYDDPAPIIFNLPRI